MRYKPNYLCDLHCHTKNSDGHDQPHELIQKASDIGMKVIAITDHDIMPPASVVLSGAETDILEYAKSLQIQLIKGIEISCDTEVEDVHILGYGCNWEDTFFTELVEFTQQSKIDGYKELISKLNEHGIDISWDEIFGPKKDKNVQKKRIFEMIAKKGYTESWGEAKIMVSSNPDFITKRKKPDPVKAIEGIHNAGGIAVLAHPYLIDEDISVQGVKTTRHQYIMGLIDSGLDGIEANYTYDKTSYKGSLAKSQISREVIEKYSGYLKVITGGSDYHGDDKVGVKKARGIGECGISYEEFCSSSLLKSLI